MVEKKEITKDIRTSCPFCGATAYMTPFNSYSNSFLCRYCGKEITWEMFMGRVKEESMVKKCNVCGKEGAVKMTITDGYMDTGVFFICPDGRCHREIVADGVAVWQAKIKKGGKGEK